MFKAVVFDIGQTLIEYNNPLNWSKLYRPALKEAAVFPEVLLLVRKMNLISVACHYWGRNCKEADRQNDKIISLQFLNIC